MTTIQFYDGTTAETPLTPNQIDWLREQAQAGWIKCYLQVDYQGVATTVNVLDVKPSRDTTPAPSPFWE